MNQKAAIILVLAIFTTRHGVAAKSADNPIIIGHPVKDAKSQSRLTVVCQRENMLKLGTLHDDLYVMYQSNQEHGNGEQILSKAGREELKNMNFSAKQLSASRDGISIKDNFDDASKANKLNRILNDKAKPADAVKAQINPTGQMKVFLKENQKEDRFILRTFAPETTHLRDKMNRKTYYQCKIFVLPEPKANNGLRESESCEVSKDDPTCIPLDVESIQ